MFLLCLVKNADVIVDLYNSWYNSFCYLVHPHLVHILRHFKPERHMEESVPSFVSIESGQVG